MTDQNNNLLNKKIEYLYSAIKDAQELIRFTDTKTAVVIPILGAFIVTYFTQISNIIKYWDNLNWIFGVPFVLFLFLLFLSILIVLRIINPTKNPIDNIDIMKEEIPLLRFYIPQNNYLNKIFFPFMNSKKFKLSFAYNDLLEQFIIEEKNKSKNIKEDDIIKTLSLEFLKVSYIRNIKMDRLKVLLWFLLFTFLTFIVSYIIFLYQFQNISHMMKYCH